MKRSEFPEKAYESMFVHELLTHFCISGRTPFYIPSQVVEKGLGYDICFVDSSGNPINRKVLLIQFKTAYEYESKAKQGLFKFEIYKGNNPFHQHNKLCCYNCCGSAIAGVYCVPRFVTYKDFYSKTIHSSIIADSVFFKPTIRLFSGHHYVTFDDKVAAQHSEDENRYEVVSFGQIVESLEAIDINKFQEMIKSARPSIRPNLYFGEGEKAYYEAVHSNSYYLFI